MMLTDDDFLFHSLIYASLRNLVTLPEKAVLCWNTQITLHKLIKFSHTDEWNTYSNCNTVFHYYCIHVIKRTWSKSRAGIWHWNSKLHPQMLRTFSLNLVQSKQPTGHDFLTKEVLEGGKSTFMCFSKGPSLTVFRLLPLLSLNYCPSLNWTKEKEAQHANLSTKP